MAKDYTKTIATAQRLITKFGRSITFVSFDETLGEAAKPWKGATAPRGAGATTLILDAVSVEPRSLDELGRSTAIDDLVKRSEQIMIVSPGSAVSLESFEEIIDDDTSRWKIVGLERLRPGTEILLYFVGVKR